MKPTTKQKITFTLTALTLTLSLYGCGSSSSTPSPANRGAFAQSIAKGVVPKQLISTGIQQIEPALSLDVPFTPAYDVVQSNMNYYTADTNDTLVLVSSRIYRPSSNDAFPVIVFNHGTLFEKEFAPSIAGHDIGLVFSSLGYIVIVPDYIGYGTTASTQHPYLHADSLANTIIDSIRAAKSHFSSSSIHTNGQWFMTGYSEGGLATMATLKKVEEEHSDEITFTAVAPNAGPYDLYGTTQPFFDDPNQTYIRPEYVPLMFFAYDNIYNLETDMGHGILQPEIKALENLFDGTHSGESISDQLPNTPTGMFTAETITAMQSSASNALKTALEANTVYQWVPQTPIRMHHCLADADVPYQNAVTALNYFNAQNAPQVELVDPNPTADHFTGYYPIQISTMQWFETF
mgnify:CR=1 FL=1